MLKKYLFPLIFYITGTIILFLPVFLFSKVYFFSLLTNILKFNFSIISILILFFSFSAFIILDIFLLDDKNLIQRNIRNIEMLLGEKQNIFLNLILCIFTGFFEEILFRGYIYFGLILLLKIFLPNLAALIISVLVLSIIFGLFHITQGIPGLIVTTLISVVFCITLIFSNTIWYAIIVHFIFNFIELSFIVPYQKKRLENEIVSPD
jgi:membrane protease YdiL (CAAX protease family)